MLQLTAVHIQLYWSELFLIRQQFVSWSRNSHFMEFDVSVLCSHEISTCSSVEPQQFSSQPPSYFWNIILPPTSVSFMSSLSLRFPHHITVCTNPLPRTCHLPHTFRYSWFEYRKCLMRDTDDEINPLTPELNPSAQRCLTRFFTEILLLESCISLTYAW
jgi:hypothetical protein